MIQKALAFIFNGTDFLALENHPDKKHGGKFFYTVTGNCEKNESPKECAIREVKEETDLTVIKCIDLNLKYSFVNRGEEFYEHCFFCLVKNDTITLNEEFDNYAWLPLEKFVNTIIWQDDKEELIKILKKKINKLNS